jgi:lysophospholipid acyltransferase (LPLAT)-like uncharacterized protein
MIPFPFTRVVIAYGEAISVPRELTAEEAEALRRRVEEGLIAANRLAEESLGGAAPWRA